MSVSQTSRSSTAVDEPSNDDGRLSLDGREKQTEFLLEMKQLRIDLAEKESRCAMLTIRLDESLAKNRSLSNELNECRSAMIQMNEDSQKSREEVSKSSKIQEEYVKLMASFLELSERYNHHKHATYENYFAKTNAINNYECLTSQQALRYELEKCRAELNRKQADLALNLAKWRNMEEANSTKEKCITELKKTLDDAKITHKHEIRVLEEYVQSLKNTIVSYEKTLANYLDSCTSEDGAGDATMNQTKPSVSTNGDIVAQDDA